MLEIGPRFRPVLFLLGGNFLGAAVGGTFFLVASSRFSLEEMGTYAVAISMQWVMFGLIGTGLAVATLRLTRDRLATADRSGAAGVVVNAALVASALALILAIAAYVVVGRFGLVFSLVPALAVLAVMWAGARALLDILRSGLLAQQDFRRVAMLTAISAATGLISLTIALLAGELTVLTLLSAHFAGLFSGAILAALLLRPLASEGIRRDSARPILDYARWPALSEGTRLLQANVGPLLVASLAGSAEAGLFGMGRYPAYIFDVVTVSLYQFWLAKAVHVPDRRSVRSHLGRQLPYAAWLGTAMIVGALITRPLLPFLGENFARAGWLFVLSSVDFAIVLLVRPIETMFHGLHRPHLELMQRCLTLPVLLGTALLLTPRWGAVGMAGAHIAGSACSLVIGAFLLNRSLKAGRVA